MYDYQLTVPDEFEALVLEVKLRIRQSKPVPKCEVLETKEVQFSFWNLKIKINWIVLIMR